MSSETWLEMIFLSFLTTHIIKNRQIIRNNRYKISGQMQQLQFFKKKIRLLSLRKFYPREIMANPLIRKIMIQLKISQKLRARELNPSEVSIGSLESQEPSQKAPSISSDKSQSEGQTKENLRDEMKVRKLPSKNFV